MKKNFKRILFSSLGLITLLSTPLTVLACGATPPPNPDKTGGIEKIANDFDKYMADKGQFLVDVSDRTTANWGTVQSDMELKVNSFLVQASLPPEYDPQHCYFGIDIFNHQLFTGKPSDNPNDQLNPLIKVVYDAPVYIQYNLYLQDKDGKITMSNTHQILITIHNSRMDTTPDKDQDWKLFLDYFLTSWATSTKWYEKTFHNVVNIGDFTNVIDSSIHTYLAANPKFSDILFSGAEPTSLIHVESDYMDSKQFELNTPIPPDSYKGAPLYILFSLIMTGHSGPDDYVQIGMAPPLHISAT